MRSLERKIGAICRAVAVKVAEGHRANKTEALTHDGPEQQGGKSPSLSLCGPINTAGGRSFSWMNTSSHLHMLK